jgi:hypothetical protein
VSDPHCDPEAQIIVRLTLQIETDQTPQATPVALEAVSCSEVPIYIGANNELHLTPRVSSYLLIPRPSAHPSGDLSLWGFVPLGSGSVAGPSS